MNKKIGFFALAAAAVLSVCIAFSFLYIGLTRNLFSTQITSLCTAGIVLIAVIFASVSVLRFIVPLFYKKNTESDNADTGDDRTSLFSRCADFASWLLFALSLSSLIAAPLADTYKYIGYGFIFASLSAVCAVLSVVLSAECLSARTKSSAALDTAWIWTLILSLIPGFGIGIGIFTTAFSTVMLREEKAPRNRCFSGIAVGISGALISACITICIAYFILLK